MTKRFSAFTDEQADQLREQETQDVHRVMVVLALLVVALALGFGYGLKLVADASSQADSAFRASQQVIRERAADARKLAAENQKKATESAQSAYAACRRQQESQPITRDFLRLLRDMSTTPQLRREYHHLHDEIEATQAFQIPKCVKPPKGTS